MQPSTNFLITTQKIILPPLKEITNNKLNTLVDRWIRPIDTKNLKIWIHKSKDKFSSTIGIGLGTRVKPNIFTFAVLDTNSVQWLEDVLKESANIYNKNKNRKKSTKDISILWNKRRVLDKIRKISITTSVIQKGDNVSIELMINSSKAFLYTDLNLNDVEWILKTLNVAKNLIATAEETGDIEHAE